MDHPEHSPQTQERLIGDLRLVIENAEELLKNTDQYKTDVYRDARAKLALALTAATEELARFEDVQLGRMIEATAARNALHADIDGLQRILRAFD
jgi:ElaB/YqjD/DUF883 family membrane-anchored ribosome-binding protein